jgi:hypothetical protein
MKAVAETAVLTNRRCEGWGSVQGALSVTRPPEVSRFGSFVKPTADWFQQRARLIRPSLRPPEFCKVCGGA